MNSLMASRAPRARSSSASDPGLYAPMRTRSSDLAYVAISFRTRAAFDRCFSSVMAGINLLIESSSSIGGYHPSDARFRERTFGPAGGGRAGAAGGAGGAAPAGGAVEK